MNTGQSKFHSVMESIANVAVGYGVAVVTQAIVFPWFGINIPIGANLKMGLVFTVISIARSYSIRRIANWYHLRFK